MAEIELEAIKKGEDGSEFFMSHVFQALFEHGADIDSKNNVVKRAYQVDGRHLPAMVDTSMSTKY